jgi:hypothetical protein
MSIAYGGDRITFSDGSNLGSGWTGFKNRIINGDMTIDQRRSGSSVSITGANSVTYTLDRWLAVGLASAGVYSVQQVAEAPPGFTNSIKATVTTAQTTVTFSYSIQQRIEGFNVADFAWGTANAQPITLSFWVRSSLTGTFGGSVTNSAFDRTYPFPYTISAANTWEYKTITIPGDTTGTWLRTNSTGLELTFGLGAEAAREATANVWANTVARQPTGTVDLISTNGATWQVTGVQLEKGSTATSFDYLPYGTEELLCKRYFTRFTSLGASFAGIGSGVVEATTGASIVVKYPVTMRSSPTATYSSLGMYDGSGIRPVTSLSTNYQGNDALNINVTASGGGLTVGRCANLITDGSSGSFSLNSEL